MEILQLKYFCDAAVNENFSKTALKYSVPASDVSQTIRRLEQEIGVGLFDRFSNKIVLNECGKAFYEHAKKALENIEEACVAARECEAGLSGEIRIQICCNRRIVTSAIEKFNMLYPTVNFRINHNENIGSDCDLIITDHIPKDDGVIGQLLIKERILLAADRESRIAKNGIEAADSLRGERFISMHAGSSMNRITNQICKNYGFSPNIVIESDDPFYIRKYLSMGMGIAFIPEISWQGLIGDNVVLMDLCGVTRETYAIRRENRYFKKTAREFLNLLADMCAGICYTAPGQFHTACSE